MSESKKQSNLHRVLIIFCAESRSWLIDAARRPAAIPNSNFQFDSGRTDYVALLLFGWRVAQLLCGWTGVPEETNRHECVSRRLHTSCC